MTMAGLYVHIPFCASRCVYCGFYSTTSLSLRERYVAALQREMDLLAYKPQIETIYLGGGTPSQLTREQMEGLLGHIYNTYAIAEQPEVTVECNPDDIRQGMFISLPVNRVSMGAQTFSDDRLRFLRRRHTARQVDAAVDMLRRDGIGNISIDLMYGFPDETMADWLADIDHALVLAPEHISAYELMYEEGTPLYRMLQSGTVKQADEELVLAMYDALVDRLAAKGYEHYEISNFALRGHGASSATKSAFRSRHNSGYWDDTPYLGIGAAAHSYYEGKRHWNPSDLSTYINNIERGQLCFEQETIDADTHYDDIVTTALRTREGIDLSRLDAEHRSFLLKAAEPHIASGRLRLTDGHLALSRKGISISNVIMADLMDV